MEVDDMYTEGEQEGAEMEENVSTQMSFCSFYLFITLDICF